MVSSVYVITNMTIHNIPVLLIGSRNIPIPFLSNSTLDSYDVTLHYI
jgi:hypothetical protein